MVAVILAPQVVDIAVPTSERPSHREAHDLLVAVRSCSARPFFCTSKYTFSRPERPIN